MTEWYTFLALPQSWWWPARNFRGGEGIWNDRANFFATLRNEAQILWKELKMFGLGIDEEEYTAGSMTLRGRSRRTEHIIP